MDLFGGGPAAEARLQASGQRLQTIAKQEGLPWKPRQRTYNTRLAQELGAWSESLGQGPAFHDAAFRAYFAEGLDISNQEVLLDLASSVGLDREQALLVMKERRFRAAVDADWTRSSAAGVTGVPTFEAGGQHVVGAQPYEVLERLVLQAGARKR